ncbi:MAG: GTPase [Firmicutes bacterium]|nr:GTPase [Bacillota bacterium]
MAKEDFEIPVYLITGFLESGKTTFLNGTIQQNYFQIPETTLLLLCEEGEEEYDETKLKKKHRTVVEVIEEAEDFTTDLLEELADKYQPERVLLEFNPFWSVDNLYKMQLPQDWTIIQHIVTVDASCFQVYMKNLKSIFVEMIRKAEMIIFNRATADLPLADFRRSVKVVNPAAEIIFEDEDHEIIDIFEDQLPYDLDADIVEIQPEDYGIWYVDMMDNPEDYEDVTVRFQGRVLKSEDDEAEFFVPGRMAMTCCADDTTFLGYVCKTPMAPQLEHGAWVEVTATVHYEYVEMKSEEEPVLYAQEIRECEELPEEMVYFN